MPSQRKGIDCVLDPPRLDAILYPTQPNIELSRRVLGKVTSLSKLDEWGERSRESVTVMPRLSFEHGEGERISRTSVAVGVGENRQHRGSASVTTTTREQFKRSGKAAKPRSRAKRTRFRRNASDPISGPLAFFHSFRCGERAQRNNAARAKARCINGVRKGVRLTTGTHKGRAPHRRGAGKQVTRKRKEGKCRKRRNACAAR